MPIRGLLLETNRPLANRFSELLARATVGLPAMELPREPTLSGLEPVFDFILDDPSFELSFPREYCSSSSLLR
ncbi:hypothetical protein M758_2G068900 [Ceratodon purpureus]|nr:hypothetical protein M758_2G068900 [Ceratodon purpureus]